MGESAPAAGGGRTRIPIPVPAGFRIIAHRGASGYAPENTRAAFRLAAEMGVREFELDVQMSADGRLVVCHDATLSRYGHGDRNVEESSWEELSSLDMGSWFSPHLYRGERMVTLDELFDEYGDTVVYHVEIKGERAKREPDVVDRLIVGRGLRSSCIVTSFSIAALASLAAVDPLLRLGWLMDEAADPSRDVLPAAGSASLFQLCPCARTVSREAVARLRSIAPEVRAWGIRGARREAIELIRAVIDAGCDGMTVDWPDWLVRGERGAEGDFGSARAR